MNGVIPGIKEAKTMDQTNERRIGFVGIIIYDRKNGYQRLNEILHEFASIIIGRLGLPYR